jgi:hypothetical protein
MVRSLLANTAFAGDFVWGAVDHGRHIGVKADVSTYKGGVPPIVDRETWRKAQERLRLRGTGWRLDKVKLLNELTAAIALYPDLITGATLMDYGCRGAHAYVRKFGSVKEAFRLVGLDFQLARDAGNRRKEKTRTLRFQFMNDLAGLLRAQGAEVKVEGKNRTLVIAGTSRVSSHLIWRASRVRVSAMRWLVHKPNITKPVDMMLLVRMNTDGTAKDFFLVPARAFGEFPLWLGDPVPTAARAFHVSTGRDLVSRMLLLSVSPNLTRATGSGDPL